MTKDTSFHFEKYSDLEDKLHGHPTCRFLGVFHCPKPQMNDSQKV